MNKHLLSVTGGARIGFMNATWPFAKLNVGPENIVLKAALLGSYEFSQDQVVSVEKFTFIPVLGWGVRINHCVINYPHKIIFWCLGNPSSLIRKIRETGFSARGVMDKTVINRGFPVRWQAIIAMIILWNVLFGLDMYRNDNPAQPGVFILSALLLVFLGSISIWKVDILKRTIMKPGRDLQEIKAWLYFLTFISGFMLIIFFTTSFFIMY